MSYLTQYDTDCAKEVAEQYDNIDLPALLAEMEKPFWWSPPWRAWAYHAAHNICARQEREHKEN